MTIQMCDHPSVAYEITRRTVLPFHWVLHTLRCVVCDTKVIVANRQKVS